MKYSEKNYKHFKFISEFVSGFIFDATAKPTSDTRMHFVN